MDIRHAEYITALQKQCAILEEALEYCARPLETELLQKRELAGEVAKRMRTANTALAEYRKLIKEAA